MTGSDEGGQGMDPPAGGRGGSPTRYPNGLEQGAPTEFYTRKEAEDAIRYSEALLRFCDHLLRG